jgi:two-component system phosphate regulon sensor histidine kinase PhoR
LGGTGLGLAIVKHIAQTHNGRVEEQSVEGEGLEFIMIIGGYPQS